MKWKRLGKPDMLARSQAANENFRASKNKPPLIGGSVGVCNTRTWIPRARFARTGSQGAWMSRAMGTRFAGGHKGSGREIPGPRFQVRRGPQGVRFTDDVDFQSQGFRFVGGHQEVRA